MIIKTSAALRNDYTSISNLAKSSKEPFEQREQMLELRANVLKAEQERINGANTMSVREARRRLRERAEKI